MIDLGILEDLTFIFPRVVLFLGGGGPFLKGPIGSSGIKILQLNSFMESLFAIGGAGKGYVCIHIV